MQHRHANVCLTSCRPGWSASLTAAVLALFLLLAAPLHAQEATAGLSSPTTSVGRPIEIVVTVRDARSADVPQSLNVPGLSIQLSGRATRFEMNNLKITSSLTYTYSLLAHQAGEFTIPPFEVHVGNKVLKTNSLRLSVAEGGQIQPPSLLPSAPQQQIPSPSGRTGQGNGNPYFGDLILSKRKAYTGEVIPAELRYYFSSSIGGEVGDRPNFTGEGFTVQKFASVPKREQIVNGENYVVFSFQTAITPAKSGTLEIPVATLEARLQLPGSAPSGFDDFFRNFGGAIPPGMFTNAQVVGIETRPTTLEVVPLPKEGRPEDFSGAIGKFKMEASVSPRKAHPGDPVTLRVVISGQGNFDAMGAPILTGDEGWRTYPPTEKFESSDAINFSGKKTYEFVLIARTDQKQTPGVRFSSLAPDTGEYEILTQAPLPVEARGSVTPTTEPTSDAPTAPKPAAATPTPVVPAAAQAAGALSWTPLLLQPAFLMVNAAIAFVWLLALIALFLRRAARSPAGLRRQRQRRLKSRISQLATATDAEFYALAADCLLAALDTEANPLAAVPLIEKSPAPTETKQILLDLLARHAESKYSSTGAKAPEREIRNSIIEILKKTAA